MSEERKKHIRTQGKYSDMSKTKIREKKQSISPATDKESLEKRNGRYSSGSRGTNNSFSGENISPIKYEENSDHSFNQLEEQKKPIEITSPGKHVLSKSENGESVIYYEPELFDDEMAWEYFDRLLNSTSWHSKNIVINGEEYAQPRLIAWFGPHSYSYSGSTLEPAEMPESILEIKEKVEGYLKKKGINAKFNSVLLNLYRSGKDSVSWHSDDETTLGIWPTIASVSLGEVRKFEMRRIRQHSENGKNPENYFVHLAHGSLIVMDGCMQDDWQHQVPKEYHDKGKRINLTFRTVYSAENISVKVPVRKFKEKSVDNWKSSSSSTSTPVINFDDEDFPPLNSDLNSSSGISSIKTDSHENTSVLIKADSSRSSKTWDSEESFGGKVNSENNMLKYSHTHDGTSANNNYAAKNTREVDYSFETNSGESRFDDSLESPSDVVEKHIDNKTSPKLTLNALAKEFVPLNAQSYQVSDNYSALPLEDLLHYKVDLMDSRNLFDFATSFKDKVLEVLPEFDHTTAEELKFMCELTDGSQTEKNQKIITLRMIKMISDSRESHEMPLNAQKFRDNRHRQYSYEKSYPDRGGRYYHNQRRNNNYK